MNAYGIILLFLFFVSLSISGCAQKVPGLNGSEGAVRRLEGGSYVVGGVKINLPINLEVIDEGKNDNIFLAFSSDYKFGVFLGVLKSNADDVIFGADIYEKGLKDFFFLTPSRDTTAMQFINDSPFSKFEKDRFTVQTFHGKSRSILNMHRIEFNDRKFISGYILTDEAENSRDSFNKALTIESAPACSSVVAIISSITGEKFEDKKDPCQANSSRPGGRPQGRATEK